MATNNENPTVVQQIRLTRREREVADFLLGGHTNRHIAEALNLSVETVKEHMQNIMRKLAVKSRAGVAAWLAQQTAAGRQYTLYVVFGDVRQDPASRSLRECYAAYTFNSSPELAAFKLGLEVAAPWSQFHLCTTADEAEGFITQQRSI